MRVADIATQTAAMHSTPPLLWVARPDVKEHEKDPSEKLQYRNGEQNKTQNERHRLLNRKDLTSRARNEMKASVNTTRMQPPT